MSLKIRTQGKIIIEKDDDLGFIIMFPTGDISTAPTIQKAQRLAKAFISKEAKSHIGFDAHIAEVEWRKLSDEDKKTIDKGGVKDGR